VSRSNKAVISRMVRTRGRDRTPVMDPPISEGQQADDTTQDTMQRVDNPNLPANANGAGMDQNLVQLQCLVLLTEHVNRLRRRVNEDRQARRNDTAHTSPVSDDEEEEEIPVQAVLPIITANTTQVDGGTVGDNQRPLISPTSFSSLGLNWDA
jgi:hypothetical protein